MEMKMRVFVIGGSPDGQPPAGRAPGPHDRVIAADYGAHTARVWGWPVHLLVGDLDSLPQDEAETLRAEGIPVITAPQAKDETDLELALVSALDDGAREIVICAALGARTDHLLANVLLLAHPALAGVRAMIADGPVTICLMRGDVEEIRRLGDTKTRGSGDKRAHLVLRGAAGDLLSLLPVGGDAAGVSTRGLAYPLRDETLYLGHARGVSNVFESARAGVWLREGLLLVIHTSQ
jgi:thiamine pyrophosphokinase